MAHLLYTQKKYTNVCMQAGFVELIAHDVEQFTRLATYVHKHAAAFWYIHALPQGGDKVAELLYEQAGVNLSLQARDAVRVLIDQLLTDRVVHIFPQLMQALVRAADERRNSIRGNIFISHTLKEEHQQVVTAYFSWLLGKQVISPVIIDPALIAGIRFETTDYLWEHSVRQQLRAISAGIYEDRVWI